MRAKVLHLFFMAGFIAFILLVLAFLLGMFNPPRDNPTSPGLAFGLGLLVVVLGLGIVAFIGLCILDGLKSRRRKNGARPGGR